MQVGSWGTIEWQNVFQRAMEPSLACSVCSMVSRLLCANNEVDGSECFKWNSITPCFVRI